MDQNGRNLLPTVLRVEQIHKHLKDNQNFTFSPIEGSYISQDCAVAVVVNRVPYNGMMIRCAIVPDDLTQKWVNYVSWVFGLTKTPATPPIDDHIQSQNQATPSAPIKQLTLLDMIKNYQALLERKDDLAEQTKANNAAIEAAKGEITQQMVDEDIPRISTGGYCFTLTAKTSYTKRSEAELAEGGLDFLDVLREEGLGDIIVEKVDPRTLQSTIKDYVEEHGELSEGLDSVIRSYEYNDITRRKESAGRKKK